MRNRVLDTEETVFEFVIPPGFNLEDTYARLRLSSQKNLPVDGWAVDGEVEDYLLSTNR